MSSLPFIDYRKTRHSPCTLSSGFRFSPHYVCLGIVQPQRGLCWLSSGSPTELWRLFPWLKTARTCHRIQPQFPEEEEWGTTLVGLAAASALFTALGWTVPVPASAPPSPALGKHIPYYLGCVSFLSWDPGYMHLFANGILCKTLLVCCCLLVTCSLHFALLNCFVWNCNCLPLDNWHYCSIFMFMNVILYYTHHMLKGHDKPLKCSTLHWPLVPSGMMVNLKGAPLGFMSGSTAVT